MQDVRLVMRTRMRGVSWQAAIIRGCSALKKNRRTKDNVRIVARWDGADDCRFKRIDNFLINHKIVNIGKWLSVGNHGGQRPQNRNGTAWCAKGAKCFKFVTERTPSFLLIHRLTLKDPRDLLWKTCLQAWNRRCSHWRGVWIFQNMLWDFFLVKQNTLNK